MTRLAQRYPVAYPLTFLFVFTVGAVIAWALSLHNLTQAERHFSETGAILAFVSSAVWRGAKFRQGKGYYASQDEEDAAAKGPSAAAVSMGLLCGGLGLAVAQSGTVPESVFLGMMSGLLAAFAPVSAWGAVTRRRRYANVPPLTDANTFPEDHTR